MSVSHEIFLFAPGFSSHLVSELEVRQHVSVPFEIQARLTVMAYVAPAELLGRPCSVEVRSTGQAPYRLGGVVTEATILGTPELESGNQIAPTYEVVIESWLAVLRGSIDSQIFQEKTTKDIVCQVLDAHGISADSFEFRLSRTYEPRTYTVQYRESALNFVSRLLEEEGIHYFESWDTEAGRQMLVFSDASTSAAPCRSEPIPLRAPSSLDGDAPAVFGIDAAHQVTSGKITMSSFTFKKALRMRPMAQSPRWKNLEVHEVSELFLTEARGKEIAQVRLEESTCRADQVSLLTNSLQLVPGAQVRVQVGALEEPLDYFVVAQRFKYGHDYLAREVSPRAAPEFSAQVVCIPLSIPFRPERVHHKPRIVGPQTATVVAPPATEPEGVHTDPYGRAKVRFHWDRYGKLDDSASCWMRVSQLQTSGSVALPRVDWEVTVEFTEGDPDRPMITGRLYNGRFMPPYELPAGKTRTSLQTASSPAGGGRNEVRFEDAAGAEEVMVNSQYNTVVSVANNRKKNVTKNETIIVGNNASLEVGGNQTAKVTKGSETTVDGDHEVSISGNRDAAINAVYGLTVAGGSETTISGNWMSMLGNPLEAIIALGAAKAAEVATAKADQAFAAVSGAAQGAVDGLMGPIKGLTDKVAEMEGSLGQLADGKLAASAGVLRGAIAIPTASDVMRSFAEGPAVVRSAEGAEKSSGQIALGSLLSGAVSGQLITAQAAVKKAYHDATASAGEGLGGTAEANQAGPVGDLMGFSEEDTAKGPGYCASTIEGAYRETVGSMRLRAAVEAVNVNVKGSMTQSIAAAAIELIVGERAESVEGASSETEPAFVLVTKADDVETVHGARQLTVGGAVMEQVGGDYSIEAQAVLMMVGAMHDMKAKSKITFKCGASSVVIDSAGVTIESPLVNVTGAGVTATKAVSDG